MSLNRDIAKLQTGVASLRNAMQSAYDVPPPAEMMQRLGMEPDPWQEDVLGSDSKRILELITRQGGKSSTTGVKAAHLAVSRPSLCIIGAPAERQSKELLRTVIDAYLTLNDPPGIEALGTAHLELANGSRVLALPGNEKTTRGFSAVDLLIIDEAARVEDVFYRSVLPMLAVSGGQLIALTTPWGKRGWFYDEWTVGGDDWERVKVTANDCPRIPKAFLEEQRRRMPDAWFRSEYLCEFTDTIDAVFRTEDIDRAFGYEDVPLLFASDDVALPVREYEDIYRLAI